MIILSETKKPCIYLITNLINQKKYIGQTTRFKERIWEHEKDRRSKMAIHNAILKYGENNFTAEVLCEVDESNNLQKELDLLEIYYINLYDSFHNGYNSTTGGQGIGQTRKAKNKILCFNYDYTEQLGEYENYSDAERQTGISYVDILYCVKNRNGHGYQMIHAGGYGWLYSNYSKEELIHRQKQVLSKGFYCYKLDKNGDPIISSEQKFFKQVEASRILEVSAGSIKQILGKKNKTTKDAKGNKYTFSRTSLKDTHLNKKED